MNLPSNHRQPLTGQHFQVAVVGGGAIGVAIARECARAGKRTLLVEQNDFAGGTTSRSTRILSGLRSLEQGDIAGARESLREKERLLRERPHLAHPAHFLMALSDRNGRSALSVRAALWVYRRMAGRKVDAAAFEMERKKLERGLDAGQHWSLFDYEDAQCEFPERLVAEWLGEAIAAGAVARNHTQVLAVDVAHGRARGLLLRDWTRNVEEKVEATWVINATGPWADRTCQKSGVKTRRPMLSGVRGSHIVVSNFPGAPGAAVYTTGRDGRPLYVIPWNEQILVGSTNVADTSDPGKVHPALDEIEHLMQSLLGMFPKARISQNHIRYAFAGVRSLPYEAKVDPGAINRQHILHDHEDENVSRMISVVGGSLTTAASVARDCARKIGIRVAEPNAVAVADAAVIDPLLDHWVVEIAETGSISEDSARAIVEWHGKRALDIARMALGSVELRTPVCPHSQHIVAEAVDAYVHECAVTLGDVLLRRVPVALGPCWSEACSREAAFRIGAVLGWNEETTGGNLEALEMERAAYLRRPRTGMKLEVAAD
ncbi:MAG TPA: FAD-dependent oxidoreductase [Terriglobales bacterium]|nr:FAD-dependent oxidoreductase [Terriglobales bacterium]